MKITQFSILTFVLVFFIGCGRKTAPEPIQEKGILPQVQKFKGHYRGKYLVFSWSIPAEQQQILSKFSFFYYQSAPRCPICKPSKKEQGVLSIKLPQKVQLEQKEDILVKSKQQKKQENISKKVTQKIELKPKITFLWEDKKKENEKPIFVVHTTHYQLIFRQNLFSIDSHYQLIYHSIQKESSELSDVIQGLRPILISAPQLAIKMVTIRKKEELQEVLQKQLLMMWPQKKEIQELKIQSNPNLLPKPKWRYYGLNLYKKNGYEEYWPVNKTPIYPPYYHKFQKGTFYGRYIDRFGNESTASAIILID